MHTYLVTGGAGFIGSHMAAALARLPDTRVVVCDRFGHGEKWRNISKHPISELVAPQDLFIWLEMNADRLTAVIHMGGISSTTERDVDLIIENNFALSSMLWRWCAEQSKPFIYASSAATYGDGEDGFDDDQSLSGLSKLRPLNPYGWSKQVFDQFVAGNVERGNKTPPQWAGLKFFNVYGPNEYHKDAQKSVVCKLLPLARAGQAVKLFKSMNPNYPDGGQQRDFIYVKDCVKVVLWLLKNPKVSGLFNLGTGQARTFSDLAHALFAALGKETHIHYIDMPTEVLDRYQYFTQANMEKLRAAGYHEPFTSIEHGVREYVQQYLLRDDQYH